MESHLMWVFVYKEVACPERKGAKATGKEEQLCRLCPKNQQKPPKTHQKTNKNLQKPTKKPTKTSKNPPKTTQNPKKTRKTQRSGAFGLETSVRAKQKSLCLRCFQTMDKAYDALEGDFKAQSDQDTQRCHAFWLVLCKKKPPSKAFLWVSWYIKYQKYAF